MNATTGVTAPQLSSKDGSAGIGDTSAGHKSTRYAAQAVGRPRVSANMATFWRGQKCGYRIQYVLSLGALAQTFHVGRDTVAFAGVNMKHAHAGMLHCYLSGITIIYRPKHRV